jgi:hypothetical protein
MTFSHADYRQLARPRYGSSNPERISNPMWIEALLQGLTAYQIRQQYSDTVAGDGVRSGHSSYRDSPAGPVWTWERFGRTTTALPDGRNVHIGGEHEDWYDLDFCIYNDVVVEHPDGQYEFLGYPKDVFPTTDFHSATLVGETIWIVGSLGYFDLRRPGETQVLTLDTRTFAIERVATSGTSPNWLHRHWAELTYKGEILVGGGEVIERAPNGEQRAATNDRCFALDLDSRTWQQVEEAGPLVFGIAADEYRRFKSPRLGTGNPERVNNPFWSVMAHRRFPPRRARDLFADHGPEPTEQELTSADPAPRPIEDVVWTAMRDDQAEVLLADGSRLSIGGAYTGYGRNRIDRRVYSDAILVQLDGRIEFLLYAPDILPAIHGLQVTYHQDRVFISGTPDRIFAAHWPQFRSILLELDRDTLGLRRVGGLDNTPEDMIVGPGLPELNRPDHLKFPLIRRWSSDPVREAILDLSTEIWQTRIISSDRG